MPDLAEAEELADRFHDVVRSLSARLVDDERAVNGCGFGGSWHESDADIELRE